MEIIKNNYRNNIIFNICLTAILIAFSVLFKFISSQIRIYGGYGIDAEYVALVLGLIILPNIKYRLILIIITPCLWFLVSTPYAINAIQVFVEYFLVIYAFFPFVFINIDNDDSRFKKYWLVSILLVICTLIKLLIHVVAGVVWWVNGNWWLSIVINSKIVLTNLGINLLLLIWMIKPCLMIKSMYYPKDKKLCNNKVIYI